MSQLTKSCAWCLTEFSTHMPTSMYCSRRHKDLAKQFRKKESNKNSDGSRPDVSVVLNRNLYTPLVITGCRLCGCVFVSIYLTKKYCSARCTERHRKNNKMIDKEIYKRRRTSDGVKNKLYFLYNGKCGICNKPIDTSIKHPAPESYSIDHIKPVSKGGSETIDNLQPSHLSCNIAKSDL